MLTQILSLLFPFKMNIPRDHHILPEAFTKRFTNSEGKIFKLKHKDPYSHVSRPLDPAAVGYERDFYLRKTPNGGIPEEIEDALYVEKVVNWSYENDICKFFGLLDTGIQRLTIDQKQRISEIMVHLRMRNDFVRKAFENTEETIQKIKAVYRDQILSNPNLTPVYKGFTMNDEQLSRISNFLKKIQPREVHIGLMSSNHRGELTSAAPELAAKKVSCEWAILTAGESENFILSDNVGLLYDKNSSIPPMSGEFLFFFPLSSKKYLRMHNSTQVLSEEELTIVRHSILSKEEVYEFNKWAISNSINEIFAPTREILEDVKAGKYGFI